MKIQTTDYVKGHGYNLPFAYIQPDAAQWIKTYRKNRRISKVDLNELAAKKLPAQQTQTECDGKIIQ